MPTTTDRIRGLILPVIDFFYPPFRRIFNLQTFRYAAAGGGNMLLGFILYSVCYQFILAGRQLDLGFYAFKGHSASLFISFLFTFPVDFAGTDKGTVYLTGKLVYSPVSKILEIKNLEFDIKSKDALLKTADWLFNRRIIQEISRNARFDLTQWIDSAKQQINLQLNREWVRGISSQGNIRDIRLIGIYPLGGSLVIRSNCSGTLAVKVDEIDFSL